MQRMLLRAKIHRARVTASDMAYVGSLTLDRDLLAAGDLLPGERVQITNQSNGKRWVTYIIAAPAGSGTVCLNGPAARWFMPGDEIVVLAFGAYGPEELATHDPRVVFVDRDNRVTRVVSGPRALVQSEGGQGAE